MTTSSSYGATALLPQTFYPFENLIRKTSKSLPAFNCRACRSGITHVHRKKDSGLLYQVRPSRSKSPPKKKPLTTRTPSTTTSTSDPPRRLSKVFKTMETTRSRRSSPPKHRLSIPARSSGTSFDEYDDPYYSRSGIDYRDPYMYPLSKSSTLETYSTGSSSTRPRRNTLTKESTPTITVGSPSRLDRDDHRTKSAHKKVYSIGESGSRLVDERDVLRDEYEPERRRDRQYHLTGSSNRNRDLDDDDFSYTTPADMYRDTEPRYRRRRGSVDSHDYGGAPMSRSWSRETGPPPTTRALDRLNETLIRREGQPPERSRTFDHNYLAPARDSSGRSSRPVSVTGMPMPSDFLGGASTHEVDHELARRSRSKYRDDEVESRGFGIRTASQAPPSEKNSPERSIDGHRPSLSIYDSRPTVAQPNLRDFLPPSSIKDDALYSAKERERDERERRLLEQEMRIREEERKREARRREQEAYERLYDRDDDGRERPRRYTKDRDELRHAANATVAAAGLGTVAYAAHKGAEKRERELELARERDLRDRDIRDRDLSIRDREPALAPPRDAAATTRTASRDPRDKERERDRERERERDRLREHDRQVERGHDGNSRRHSSDDEDVPPPRRQSDNPRRSREEIEAEEDYNRRLQQQQRELGLETSVANGKSSRHGSTAETTSRYVNGGVSKEISPIEPPSASNTLMSGALVPVTKDEDRVVEPPKTEAPAPVIKGILRKPTEKFPEHKDTIREGVAPLKEEAARKGIPVDAKWTKIDRKLVNPDALEEAKERYEERKDCVIVLRVLTKEEIQKLADRTKEIRARRDSDS